MRLGRKPKSSLPSLTRRQRAATWLEDSPSRKIIVAIAAMVAFVLSLANAAWTAYREYEQARLKVVIAIRSRTSYPLHAHVSMDQLFGHAFPNASGQSQPAAKIEMPYYPVVISMQNPTGKKSTLSDCVLKIRFYEREGEHESTGYMTEDALKSLMLHETPIATIESGAMMRVEWLFFFLPDPTLQKLLSDKSTQAFRFQAGCRDEAGREVISAWR